jgi:hypothetical protein
VEQAKGSDLERALASPNRYVEKDIEDKRTLERASGMSALPSRADMLSAAIDVCYVPIADIGSRSGAELPLHESLSNPFSIDGRSKK